MSIGRMVRAVPSIWMRAEASGRVSGQPKQRPYTQRVSVTELVAGAIGSMLVALGGASILAWSLRRRASDRLPLYFGIWCCLYGVRLLALQPFVRTAFGGSARPWQYASVFITYAIN